MKAIFRTALWLSVWTLAGAVFVGFWSGCLYPFVTKGPRIQNWEPLVVFTLYGACIGAIIGDVLALRDKRVCGGATKYAIAGVIAVVFLASMHPSISNLQERARRKDTDKSAWLNRFPSQMKMIPNDVLSQYPISTAGSHRRDGKVLVASHDATDDDTEWSWIGRGYLPPSLVPTNIEEVANVLVVYMPVHPPREFPVDCYAWVIDWRGKKIIAKNEWHTSSTWKKNVFLKPGMNPSHIEELENVPKTETAFTWFVDLPVSEE